MNQIEKDKLLCRIISGVLRCNIDGKVYIIKQAPPELRYEAQEIYNDTLYKNSFEGWLTEQQARGILVSLHLLKPDFENRLKESEKVQDDKKVELYQNMFNDKLAKQIRNQLKLIRNSYNDILTIKHSLDHTTVEGYAEIVRTQFIMQHTVVDELDNLVDIDNRLLEALLTSINEQRITAAQFKELARTEPWRTDWYISKEDVFGKPSIYLTEEQKTLIGYSKMYDNVYDHSECPSETVINDDDLLEGWMITMKRKRDSEKNISDIDRLLADKQKHADDIFVPLNYVMESLGCSEEEARKKIEDSNLPESRMIKAQRAAVLRQRGEVKEEEFPDIQQRMQMQATQQQMRNK